MMYVINSWIIISRMYTSIVLDIFNSNFCLKPSYLLNILPYKTNSPLSFEWRII